MNDARAETHDSPLQLTVVTPVKNAVEHIAACIESVAAQDLTGVEHLVLDGGSTDGTLDVARELAARYPHVRLVEGHDEGQSEAMNKGVGLAMAPILGFLNADDVYLPGAIASAVAALRTATEPSFFWGALLIRYPNRVKVWRPGRFEPRKLLVGPAAHPYPINPAAYFYHRSLHDVAGTFDEQDHYAMDADFLIRASFHVSTVIRTHEVLGEYRLVPGSKTFDDEANGTGSSRITPILERYLADLPPRQRLQVRVERVVNAPYLFVRRVMEYVGVRIRRPRVRRSE